ncbi:SLATT domain-containing protein [Tateyamaria sp. ANG-S1]|uniref:SLATT domain-containing protein n=1 Tax=Tateyamaria sp. ANG-S1 TaxID=1577905 RepID=UPI00126A3E0F|nr:SLATT domain-containing protein [Tateyamaria sp. ANG-S1]
MDGYDDYQSDPETTRELFCMWNERLLIAAAAHYSAANYCEASEKTLSIFNISFAISVLFFSSNGAYVGSFMSLFGLSSDYSPLLVSTLSLLVVLSSAAQYILQFGNRAALHKQAGNEFSNLRRKIERYWSKNNIHPEAVHSLNRTYNMITKSPPLVGSWTWKKAKRDKIAEADLIKESFYCGVREETARE